MGRRGRMRARERFSTEEMVQRYVKVYESLR
jgi:glycosyltransferase involved in cell wall biosynthesis